MDTQLKWLLRLLNEHQLPYWVNSGTLLGLMREGDLLGHDLDLDISLWAEHEESLRKLIPIFKEEGYTVLSASYQGATFQYNFSTGEGSGKRNIDIGLFRRWGNYAWCPEYYFKVNPAKSPGKSSILAGTVRGVLRICWRKLIAVVPLKVNVSGWPWRNFVNLGTWWVPAEYFDQLTFRPELNAFIPADWESYLKFRYGSWQEPNKNWVFHRDDGAFKDLSPHLLVQELP